MARTPEEGHTYKCLAKTMIAVIENERDYLTDLKSRYPDSTLDFDFRVWAQDNNALHVADGYLKDGTSECICPDLPKKDEPVVGDWDW